MTVIEGDEFDESVLLLRLLCFAFCCPLAVFRLLKMQAFRLQKSAWIFSANMMVPLNMKCGIHMRNIHHIIRIIIKRHFIMNFGVLNAMHF